MRQNGFAQIIIIILLLILIGGGAYYFGTKKGNILPTPTQTSSSVATGTPTQSTPTPKPEDEIVEAAKKALSSKLNKEISGTVGLAENSLTIKNDWAFGTMTISSSNNTPEAHYFLARNINGSWQAAIEYTDLFKSWLNISPDGLVNPDLKKLLL